MAPRHCQLAVLPTLGNVVLLEVPLVHCVSGEYDVTPDEYVFPSALPQVPLIGDDDLEAEHWELVDPPFCPEHVQVDEPPVDGKVVELGDPLLHCVYGEYPVSVEAKVLEFAVPQLPLIGAEDLDAKQEEFEPPLAPTHCQLTEPPTPGKAVLLELPLVHWVSGEYAVSVEEYVFPSAVPQVPLIGEDDLEAEHEASDPPLEPTHCHV